jgi:hypothetical protein
VANLNKQTNEGVGIMEGREASKGDGIGRERMHPHMRVQFFIDFTFACNFTIFRTKFNLN